MNKSLQKVIDRLKDRSDLQTLTPKQVWDSELDSAIAVLEFPKQDTTVTALMAGLHLWNDSLNTSHSFAQKIEDDATGSYWHAIMHRMEQDYSNSKYWFRRAGDHPVKDKVQLKAAEWLKQQGELDSLPSNSILNTLKQFRDQQNWNCDAFVDIIVMQESGEGSDETRQLLEELQHIELKTLFDHSYEAVEA